MCSFKIRLFLPVISNLANLTTCHLEQPTGWRDLFGIIAIIRFLTAFEMTKKYLKLIVTYFPV